MTCLPSVMALCASLTGSPSVVDGDTLRFGSQSVRLHGLDAEERHEPNGPAATEGLRRIVAGTRYVTCKAQGSFTHNRIVAVCYTAEGYDVAALMVSQGLALDCTRYSKARYRYMEPAGARERLLSKPYCAPSSTR